MFGSRKNGSFCRGYDVFVLAFAIGVGGGLAGALVVWLVRRFGSD